jgi:thiamine monophosphate synthase
MKLEDAFIYVVLGDDLSGPALVEAGTAAIAGGADALQVRTDTDDATLQALRGTCREEEALFLLRDDMERVEGLDADGMHLSPESMDFGIARAMLDEARLIGMTSRSLDDARLAIEVGADYVLHEGGAGCIGTFAALHDEARVPLFASGITSLEEAREIVGANIFRLCLNTEHLETGNMTEAVAGYARLLGRSI